MPTHTRIRMFNTKETYPNQSLDNDLCQAVRAGNTVYVRGQVGTDFAGNLVGLGDPQAQAEQAMKNVKQLLEEAGSDLSHIVKTTTYIIDPRYREPVYQEVGKWLKGVFPISTGLVISALAQLEQGLAPDIALRRALAEDDFSRYRQIIAIDANGQTAAFSGDKTLGIYHVAEGENCIAAGNMLASTAVIEAMVTGFQQSEGEMALRLLAALQAGLACGGEAGPVHSAAVKVVDDYSWPLVDLRIDWSEEDPIGELAALWQAYEPQMQAYITRALDPREAPSYGVPGDE